MTVSVGTGKRLHMKNDIVTGRMKVMSIDTTAAPGLCKGLGNGLGGLSALARRAALAVTLACAAASLPMAPARSDTLPKLDFAGSVTFLGMVPIMVAVDQGYFKDEGLDVNFQVILSSVDRLMSLTSGSTAFSNLGRTAVIAQMARGNDSFYWFGNIDQAPRNEGCWARPGIASFQDLKGKKIAANTSAEMTMGYLLQSNGMTKKDIQFVDLPPTEMVVALSKGDVDAVCVWQPFLDNAKKLVPQGKLLGTDMDTDSYKKTKTVASADILVISRKLVDEHPDQARKLAAAIFKGVEYTNADPEETAKLVAHYFKKPPEEILAGMKTFQYPGETVWQARLKGQEDHMREFAQWLVDNKKIPAAPDVTKWLNTSFLPKS